MDDLSFAKRLMSSLRPKSTESRPVNKLSISKSLIRLLPDAKDGGWIVDGGCHVGSFANQAMKEFPTSSVLAFEPDPDSWKMACINVGREARVEVVNAALGAETTKAEFFRGPISVTNSLLPRPSDDLKPYYPEQASLEGGFFVDVVTIDEECEKRGVKELSLLKLDLQGGELSALHGAKSLLGRGAVRVIVVEAVFVRKYHDQPLLWELWRYLEGFGYSLYSLEEVKVGLYHAEAESMRQWQWNQCDVIFVSNSVRQALDKQG